LYLWILYGADIVTAMKVRRVEWAGHVVRMDDERMVKRVFLGNPGEEGNPEDQG
jgi:hypothetical protein